jgi:hypothetical protein
MLFSHVDGIDMYSSVFRHRREAQRLVVAHRCFVYHAGLMQALRFSSGLLLKINVGVLYIFFIALQPGWRKSFLCLLQLLGLPPQAGQHHGTRHGLFTTAVISQHAA